jgi:hypothetical protein
VYVWTRMATSVQTVLSYWQFRRKYPVAPRSLRASGGTLGALIIVIAPALLFAWAMIYSAVGMRKWGPLNLASGLSVDPASTPQKVALQTDQAVSNSLSSAYRRLRATGFVGVRENSATFECV